MSLEIGSEDRVPSVHDYHRPTTELIRGLLRFSVRDLTEDTCC